MYITETRNISAPLHLYRRCTSIVDVAICTSIVDAPLSTYANLGAICTSIAALELYPSAYADLKEIQVRMQRFKSTIEVH